MLCRKDLNCCFASYDSRSLAFFVIRLYRGRMTKKESLLDRYPGLRLLRGLALGYYLPPLRGFRMAEVIFSTENSQS